MPMFRPIKFARLYPGWSGQRLARAGFSLIEILIVLTVMALATAIIMPGMSRMLDQATAHAVFFEFQRDVANMRREASRTGEPLRLIDPATPLDVAAGDRRIVLRTPWRYTIAPAMDIAEGGVCAPTTVNLLTGDRLVMTLRSDTPDCRFMRLQTTAAPPRERPS